MSENGYGPAMMKRMAEGERHAEALDLLRTATALLEEALHNATEMEPLSAQAWAEGSEDILRQVTGEARAFLEEDDREE